MTTTTDPPTTYTIVSVPITSTIEVTASYVQDIFTTAIEGGVNYWADIESYQWNDDKPAEFKAVLLAIASRWGGTPVKYHVDLAVMMKGLTRYAETYGVARLASLLDPDFGDYDAIDADMIVQFGIFGKVVYG